MDPTTGQWVGEHETRRSDGEVNRRTEWFGTEAEARRFARTGELAEAELDATMREQMAVPGKAHNIRMTPTTARAAFIADAKATAARAGLTIPERLAYVAAEAARYDATTDAALAARK